MLNRTIRSTDSVVHMRPEPAVLQLRNRLCMSVGDYCKEAAVNDAEVISYLGDETINPRKTIFYNNHSDILAVAHLDVAGITRPVFQDGCVNAMQLDDRLGVWVIMDLLPLMLAGSEQKYDVLLTTGEEKCQSTARNWVAPGNSRYRYMFALDRQGTGSVAYQYGTNNRWVGSIEPYLGPLEMGSYNDICELEHLGCCGVNIGVGYHLQHSHSCYALISDTFTQAVRCTNMIAGLSGVFAYPGEEAEEEEDFESDFCCDSCDRRLVGEIAWWDYCPYCGSMLYR